MKKLLTLLLFLPSFCFADRLGSLRSGADVLLTTQTVNITTVQSSFTVNGANGELVRYQVNAGSMTGAGLTNCGDSSHAVSWNSTTNLFGCQTIAGSSSSGASIIAVGTGSITGYTGTITSTPTTIVLFDSSTFTSKFIGGTTVFIGINVLPASSIAAGSLGAGVIASSLSVNAVYPSAVTSSIYGNITGVGIQGQALNMGTQQINNVVDPSSAQDAATRNYVDTNVNSLYWKQSARLGTITALPANTYNDGSSGVGATLTEIGFGALSIDGVAPSLSDRVLVKNEVTTANNGIYSVTAVGSVVAAYVLTRTADYNQTAEVQAGDSLFITSGTTLSNSGWIQVTSGTITMGFSPIVFNQFTGLGEVTAGYGLTTSGNVISLLTNTTSYIQNRSTLQSGATSYPDFLQVGSSATLNILGVNSNLTASGGINISSGVFFNTTVITSTSVITSTMSVILASCTTRGATPNVWITLTLPPAPVSPTMDYFHIYNVGADSCSIRIYGNGTDLIESTGVIRLDAQNSHAYLESTGSGLWGGEIQATPWSIFTTQDDVGTFTVAVASQVTMCPVYVPVPIALTGFRVNRGTGSGPNTAGIGFFDMNNKFIVGLSTMTLLGNPNTYLTGSVTQLAKGWYKVGYTASNTVLTITGSNTVNSTKLFCGTAGTSTTGMDLSGFTPASPLTAAGATYPAIDLIFNGGLQGF